MTEDKFVSYLEIDDPCRSTRLKVKILLVRKVRVRRFIAVMLVRLAGLVLSGSMAEVDVELKERGDE